MFAYLNIQEGWMRICGHTTVNGFCHGFYDVMRLFIILCWESEWELHLPLQPPLQGSSLKWFLNSLNTSKSGGGEIVESKLLLLRWRWACWICSSSWCSSMPYCLQIYPKVNHRKNTTQTTLILSLPVMPLHLFSSWAWQCCVSWYFVLCCCKNLLILYQEIREKE